MTYEVAFLLVALVIASPFWLAVLGVFVIALGDLLARAFALLSRVRP